MAGREVPMRSEPGSRSPRPAPPHPTNSTRVTPPSRCNSASCRPSDATATLTVPALTTTTRRIARSTRRRAAATADWPDRPTAGPPAPRPPVAARRQTAQRYHRGEQLVAARVTSVAVAGPTPASAPPDRATTRPARRRRRLPAPRARLRGGVRRDGPASRANNRYGMARFSSQCPNNTHAPPSNATLAASAISVVLPTPASPLTTTTSRPPSTPTRLTQSPTTLQLRAPPTTPPADVPPAGPAMAPAAPRPRRAAPTAPRPWPPDAPPLHSTHPAAGIPARSAARPST